MAFAPQKPPRTVNFNNDNEIEIFQEHNNSRTNSIASTIRGSKRTRDTNKHGRDRLQDEPRELTRSNFVIPPPSRKYTTTNPGTLSPIYHLVYDLTAPTTVSNTTTSFLHTLAESPHRSSHHPIPLPPRSPLSPRCPEGQSYPETHDDERLALGHAGHTKDGFGLLSSPGIATTGHNTNNNFPADKSRSSNKKDLRNRDARITPYNNNRAAGEIPFSSAPLDTHTVDERSDNTGRSFFSHSKQWNKIAQESVNDGGDQHAGVRSRVGVLENQNGGASDPNIPELRSISSTSENRIDSDQDIILTDSQIPQDIAQSRLQHSASDINNGSSERGGNSLPNTVHDNRCGGDEDFSENPVCVKRAIDIWTNRSKGVSEIIGGDNHSPTAYQQSEQGNNARRVVFKREGDCVRLFLVDDVDNNANKDNNNVYRHGKDTACNREIQAISAAREPGGGKFSREGKSNTSQRWLNKLGLLSPRGNNSKTTTKGNRKKESKSAKNNHEQSAINGKEKHNNRGEEPRPTVSKKPVNRWDSIHVHTKQAMASATGLERQIGLTKDVSFAQTGSAPISPGHHEAALTSDVTSRHASNWMSDGGHVTDSCTDKVTVKPTIKGILVNKARGCDANECHESNYRHARQQAKQNGVQFIVDTAVSSPHSSHSNVLSSPSSSSFSTSPPSVATLSSHPRREVIDRSKYIIKPQRTPKDTAHRLHRSHDSALSVNTNDPIARLDNLIGVFSERTPGADQSVGFDPSIINDAGSSEGQHSSSLRITGRREDGQTWTTSDTTSHRSSVPGCGGSSNYKHAPGGSAHTGQVYSPLLGGCSEHFDHRETQEVNASGLSKWSEDRNDILHRNYNNNNNNGNQILLDPRDAHRWSGRSRFPVEDQTTTLLTSVAVCKQREEEGVGFGIHSTVTHRDSTTTATVEGEDDNNTNNKQVDGVDTLRYRRTLREAGKKHRNNLHSVDQSSWWIKRRFGDLNTGFIHDEGILTTQRGADNGVQEVATKPPFNPKPKITPRQKFEITHNLPSGKVATNLRHNHDRSDPLLSIKESCQGEWPASKLQPPAADVGVSSNFTSSSLYKESPRARFERDRAARIHNNNLNNTNSNIHNHIHATGHLVDSTTSDLLLLGRSIPCSERLNKSCDDLDLETDSDGYLKPSTNHKSRSTETLLSHSDPPTPLVPNLKLTPRARFENSRVHANLKAQSRAVSSQQEAPRRDNCQASDLRDSSSWTNSFPDLDHQSVSKPVQDTSFIGDNQQNEKSTVRSSHQAFPYSEGQRNRLTAIGVRSVQSSEGFIIREEGHEEVEEEEEEEDDENETRRGGEGHYGTSGEERFLSQQRATHLSSTANIDTSAPRWSGTGDEEGIRSASDERRAKQLSKSRAERSILLTTDEGLLTKSVFDTDRESVPDARFLDGNSKISYCVNSASSSSSHKSFVISNNSHPPGDPGGPHEQANSANRTETSGHGSLGQHSEGPRPSQVLAVKKMSPDSVSSSGYESEHTSSAIFHKCSKNVKSAFVDNYNNNNNNNNNNKHDWNSLERNTPGVSAVKELRQRFGHTQQQQQQILPRETRNNRWNKYRDPTNQLNANDNNDHNLCASKIHVENHVILSDDRYDDSLVPGIQSSNTCAVSNNNVKPRFPSTRADVNNNNSGSRRPSTESDTCVRYDYTRDKIVTDDNRNETKVGCENGFSDSQLLNKDSTRRRGVNVNFDWDPTTQLTTRYSPREKKHHNKLEKVSRSMHEIIHDLKLDSGELETSKRSRRSRRCSKCQDNSSPNFCPHCKHVLDCGSRDSPDSEGISPSNNKSPSTLLSESSFNIVADNFISDSKTRLVQKQTRVSHSISEVAAMLASKGLRIYEDTGEYVPMKSPLTSPTLASLPGHPPFNVEAARYLIVPTIIESINGGNVLNGSENKNVNETLMGKSQRQLATDALAQRSISDSGASASRSIRYFPHEDEINNGAHSDGDICDDDAYLSMGMAGVRQRAMSMDVLCSDGAVPDGDDSTDAESSSANPPQKVTSRLRRKDRRSSKGYVEWRTCSGWVGKTDMRLAEGRNSRGYIEWDTIWSTATPWKMEGVEDEHVYDVINDESASQSQAVEPQAHAPMPTTAENASASAITTTTIDTPPALPERTYMNRLKNVSSPAQSSRRHSPHQHHSHHPHHHHHHHHHHHGGHHHSHHHNNHSPRHQPHSHSHSGGRRSHGHHHRSSPQSSSSCSNATPKLKSASKPPPPAPPPPPPVQSSHELPSESQNYAQVSKLKGYTFTDSLTSSAGLASHLSSNKSVIYSENYWHIGPVTSEERLTSWQTGDVLDYIDGLHDSMSPKRRENIYILLNNKKTRAKFSESLEIESRLLSKGLLCRPGNKGQKHNDLNLEEMDTSTTPTITTATATTHDPVLTTTTAVAAPSATTPGASATARGHKVRTSVSSTYV